ncbi:glycosyl transferase [Stenotrophomonas sp. SAU14A_NAIMI4_5]|uniref:glycosyltransferase n=1 Tax=Stenotrophomonas sp. SAU14A_NAIMI4_5 TaxID=2072413 RepID=UPI000D540391|nr:glycosyltransferase [Stenotrophomonas sp. SAU14A_NAIMI4_5]AWH48207.1 glycosyl transferase [Stenotrophomonas sp. SAU14A_NAIMI4_5]
MDQVLDVFSSTPGGTSAETIYLRELNNDALQLLRVQLASTHAFALGESEADARLTPLAGPSNSALVLGIGGGLHASVQHVLDHLSNHPDTRRLVLVAGSEMADGTPGVLAFWQEVLPSRTLPGNGAIELLVDPAYCSELARNANINVPLDLAPLLDATTKAALEGTGLVRALWTELLLSRIHAASASHERRQLLHRQEVLTRSLNRTSLSAQASVGAMSQAHSRITDLLHSRSWRVTAPMRAAGMLVRRARNMYHRLRGHAGTALRLRAERGTKGVLKEFIRIASSPRSAMKYFRHQDAASNRQQPVYKLPPASPALTELSLRVLIIADMNLAQCTKYRVLQKQQMIQDLGIDCSIVRWEDLDNARGLLSTHTVAIFYRVPGFEQQLESIARAKALGMRTIWEVDDLIFDESLYQTNSNLADLDQRTRQSLLNGVPLYRAAMLACDHCIASTVALAEAMRSVGAARVDVVNNALDDQTLLIAEEINAKPQRKDGLVRVVYGSGSASHDSDFRQCADAMLATLREHYHVRLTIVGTLNLPPAFKEVEDQIERLPPVDYASFLERISRCDINIAPLEPSVFNDAKSNIKYLEAAILKLPSICSPSQEYRNTIVHGETGMLAASPGEWKACLDELIADAALRQRIGKQAYRHVVEHYTPQVVAREQVLPLFKEIERFEPARPRILGVNIFFEPRSFGGATIVAEEIARCINASGKAEYAMVTSLPCSDAPPYNLVRYRSSAAEVFAMGLPFEADPAFDFDNPFTPGAFRQILRAWRPDVVHLHSIQGFGVQIAEACQEAGIPYVVTMHDAWWICARQFMITGEGKYCHQSKVDLNVCAKCVANPVLNPYRQHRLHEVLSGAAMMLAPSRFFRGVYVDNGFDPSRVQINKNGVVPPRRSVTREPLARRKLRLGFVGGEGPAKGSELIKEALRQLPHTNYELHVVDAALNLGRRHIFEETWGIPGTLKIVPAYTQSTIDDFFASVDVLLFPTQCKESFGLTVREAMLRDTWVIATDAGGAVEDIIDGANGDIVPLINGFEPFREALRRLLDNPEQLDGYHNPHPELIRVFSDQADELLGFMGEVMERFPARHLALPRD